ncbi:MULTISPECIES: alpha/beta fold hydrolase [Streptomyces]|uniref:Alpha/beta fold hydrolase n=1 Tax=Streptomyces caniscabiei TaxID=2746961 RepID=A0ABU4MX07_9ACTN|nr:MULTISPECIES: alpha/beta fold hydrolase [Streptomyces]MBE4739539.1 alpha/beta fold hydrolase [Streptomyces caniscabiei]MBE4760061.1 alpha/beta fold hydrolase [Streptomyces caniscabiei]MBE4772600.1 alpha/beta fold hydrolase [Streptomyces caniscabiei]MBE4784528.1 alpha/beta fold hydrolase [Streptomyces caniscabiei]MBE4798229.1 alpha/beta fold hydrolase [Streptomyces caniscabiei]
MQENRETHDVLVGRERIVPVDGIELWAEEFGGPEHPVVLLVMGAQAQGVQWNDGIVRRLVGGGRRVIRYDHRDTGRSSVVDFAVRPYTVADLASDALAVLDAFGVRKAHLVGASLGGIIAQRIAVTDPERVLTLTSLSSQPLGTDMAAVVTRAMAGKPPAPGQLPPPEAELLAVLAASLPDPEAGLEAHLALRLPLWRVLHGQVLPFDEEEYRAMERRVFERARDLAAGFHHTLAGAAGGDDTAALASVTAPTLVLHGTEDPMFPPAHAEATAAAVPGAELVMIEGLGHTLPSALDARLAEEILRHTA